MKIMSLLVLFFGKIIITRLMCIGSRPAGWRKVGIGRRERWMSVSWEGQKIIRLLLVDFIR